MNDEEFVCLKFLKLKHRRGDQIIQLFCRIGSPQEIRSPLFNLRKSQITEKSTTEPCRTHWNVKNDKELCRNHWNLMIDKEFGSFKFLNMKYRRRGGTKYLSPSAELASLKKLGPPFSLRKSQITEKSTTESCRTHWNVKNDKEFESFNFLKMKYKKGDWIIQSFWNIGFPKKLSPPL